MLATFVLLLLGLVVWIVWPRSEPQFQGMPASDYAQSIISTNIFNFTFVTNRLAPMGRAVAISAITSVLAREDSPWKHRYQKILPRAPLWLRRRFAPPKFDQNLITTCIMALGSFGPEAKPAVRTLATSLDQGSDSVKWLSAEALSRIGPDARTAIPSLIATALSPGTGPFFIRARTAAIRALASVDPTGERSAHKLATLFDDPDATVAAAVIGSFSGMAKRSPSLVPQARAALEPFIQRLQTSDATNRAFGATVLMYAQYFERDVVPVLLQAALDTNAVVREAYHIGDSIVRFLEERRCDLIVMGDTGRGLLGRFFLGSVSRFVLSHAGCSVWIVRRPHTGR